jgi:hypothetical protein
MLEKVIKEINELDSDPSYIAAEKIMCYVYAFEKAVNDFSRVIDESVDEKDRYYKENAAEVYLATRATQTALIKQASQINKDISSAVPIVRHKLLYHNALEAYGMAILRLESRFSAIGAEDEIHCQRITFLQKLTGKIVRG